MNLVYTTPEGGEIWLGDYYAATDLNLLKQKKITAGTRFIIIQYLPQLRCLELNTLNKRILTIKYLTLSISQRIK